MLLLKQSPTYLVCYMCVCMSIKIRPPPHRNGISTRNFLISSLNLGSPQKFILEWYSFSNRSLKIALLQIYSLYYKTISGHLKHGGLFLLQTTQPMRMQGQQKCCHLLEKRPLAQWECRISRHSKYHMKWSNHNAGFPDTTKSTCWRRSCLANEITGFPDTTKTMCYQSATQCWQAFLVSTYQYISKWS